MSLDDFLVLYQWATEHSPEVLAMLDEIQTLTDEHIDNVKQMLRDYAKARADAEEEFQEERAKLMRQIRIKVQNHSG